MCNRHAHTIAIIVVLLHVAAPKAQAQVHTTNVTLDARTTEATVTRGGPAHGRSTLRFGVTADVNYFPSFQSTLGDQPNIVDFTGQRTVPGYGLFAEYTSPLTPKVSVGLAFHRSRQDLTQTYSSTDPLYPTSARGTVTGSFYDFYTAWNQQIGNVGAHFTGGFSRAVDDADLDYQYAGGTGWEARQLSTWKARFGAGACVGLPAGLGARASVAWTSSFKSGDADANLRLNIGLFKDFTF